MFRLILIAILSLIAAPAYAQEWDYTPNAQYPGQNAQVYPGYTQPPLIIQHFGNGFSAAPPGQMPYVAQPAPGGSWIVTPPLNPPLQAGGWQGNWNVGGYQPSE